MANIDPVFGMHADALAVQAKRMDVLAANIANADTPHYQARDIDFAKVLASTQGAALNGGTTMATTNPLHLNGNSAVAAAHDPLLAYRVPLQPSVDGNTVDEQVEQAKFADAALHYQASLTFMNGQIKTLLSAITGQ
jgi:flagellar basal-body rod protein FlgB